MLTCGLCNIGTIFFVENLLIRSFIFSEMNTYGLAKFNKIRFPFKIFIPIPVQEMSLLKAIQTN